MQRVFWTVLALISILFPSGLVSQAAPVLPKLGVAAFESSDLAQGKQIAEVFLTDLSRTGKLSLVEREQLDKAIKELALAQTGLVDANTAARIGKLVGAQKLVVGSFVVHGNQVALNARLMDVGSSQIEVGENIEGSSDQLFFLIHQLANRLHRRLTGEWIPPVEAAGSSDPRMAYLEQLNPTKWAKNADSPLEITIQVNKGTGSTYTDDEPLTMSFRVDVKDRSRWGEATDCYFTLYNMDAAGKIYLVFPNHWAPNNKVTIGKTYKVPDDTYELGFVGDPGEEHFVGVATRQPLELVEGMQAKLREETIPQVSNSAHDFGTRGVVPKMKKLKPTDWGAGQTHFFREKKK